MFVRGSKSRYALHPVEQPWQIARAVRKNQTRALEAEVADGERADRANVLGHERVIVIELSPRRNLHFAQVAALSQIEDRVFRELVARS